ncbi:AAA family ATPase [Achromobacter sp. GG226]|uniref:ATP-dependent DNA helicase n=1 Tax=Verticiella alkaliphila TaxID=2779529 RepID=UPI001C0B7427|nr:AAA family ATPase [Verticiella sp. GG226]MBU4610323.1 AAA family ATPase [Verticiella sp. GG226]
MRIKALTHAAGKASPGQIGSSISSLINRGMIVVRTATYRPAANARDGAALTAEGWMEQIRRQGRSAQAAEALVTNAVAEGRLIPDAPSYTTPQARRRELSVLRVEQDGRESIKPVLSMSDAQTVLNDAKLSPGQRQAAELMLTTSNRVVGVQGLAGTGKSHMLKPTLKAIEAAGYKVQTVASYGAQVRALRDLGVESATIASMLGATTAGRFVMDSKTVLVVDEAGVVPARLMDKLLVQAERANARVVLIGDTGQTKAIEAGKPFDQLQAAGMTTALMGEIKRQLDPVLREAVVLASQGKAHDSLEKITNVQQFKDKADRWEALAAAFAERDAATRDNTLIVTGTNESRRAINDLVRTKLGLDGTGRDYTLLRRRDTTQAERRHSKYFVRGDIIQPERNYASGLKRGTMYTILGSGEGNMLKVVADDGSQVEFDPRRTLKLSVYEPESAELAVGDWIRITRNDAARDLATGNRFQVSAMDDTNITLTAPDREVKLPATERLHVDLAYATTVHGSQGLTSDHVLFHADSKSRTTSKEVYYVAVSRARHTAEIFTDDASRLPASVMRAAEKGTALELAS